MDLKAELWDQVQQIRVGASSIVCDRCSSRQNPYPYDERPYGTALAAIFPNIAKWCHGYWDENTVQECLDLFRYAVGHRSRPMLGVGVAAVANYPQVKRRIWDALTEEEKAIVGRMLKIGIPLS